MVFQTDNNLHEKNPVKILLIYTGGTIGMSKDFKTGALKAFNFKKLLQKIPEINLLACEIETISFDNPIDSSNMDVDSWVLLSEMIEQNYNLFDGFVILHGSDTMSYTASALSFMFENLSKPIILTGSQLPIGDLRTDAKENLITAIQIASLQSEEKPVIQEVALYFEYKLYRGNRTTKINAEHFNAFTSPNYPALAESGVNLTVNRTALLDNTSAKELKIYKELEQNVLLLKIFPGMSKHVFQTLFSIKNLKGVVLETYGAGNAPNQDWFINPIAEAIKSGIHVINITQCFGGSVNMGQYETSTRLQEIGVISGKNITSEAGITKLMFLLGQNTPDNQFKSFYETALRGEMS
uniref:asparaginase n=1 Tax=Flavobacterium sp. TaxID=239 RepID=UPI00404978B8